MPMYKYQCPACLATTERFRKIKYYNRKPRCESCGVLMPRVPHEFLVDPWKPITLEHINVEGEEPLHFKKRGELRDYCRKHGLASSALL